MTPGRRFLGLAMALLAAGLPAARAAHKNDPDKLPSIRVQDLHYGDVLFHYWADQDAGLGALTRLEAYNHWQRMPHHAVDSQLLAASLYLQLNMHNEAGARFETLLGDNIPVGVRNRAWFYLGKIWYERGYFERSEQALQRIQGNLAPASSGQRADARAALRRSHCATQRLAGTGGLDGLRELQPWSGAGARWPAGAGRSDPDQRR
jgi:tetratricopeptide (TPR) repeat protein